MADREPGFYWMRPSKEPSKIVVALSAGSSWYIGAGVADEELPLGGESEGEQVGSVLKPPTSSAPIVGEFYWLLVSPGSADTKTWDIAKYTGNTGGACWLSCNSGNEYYADNNNPLASWSVELVGPQVEAPEAGDQIVKQTAYGLVNPDGSVVDGSSGNFSVKKTGPGGYTISINGGCSSIPVAVANVRGGNDYNSAFAREAATQSGSGVNIIIATGYTDKQGGQDIAYGFSFIAFWN